MSYVGILRLSGGNFRFLLFTVIIVSGVCILIVLCSVFLNWVCWARGNFLASRVTYIFVCVSLRCVECRAGTSIFECFVGVGGGTVRIFYFLWLCFGGYGTIEMVRGLVRVSPLFSSVCCQFSWRVDMCGRNIVLYFLLVIL
jgi:hypothetical protein